MSSFPSGLLAPLLLGYSQGLAGYMGLPPEVPATLCLAAVGAAIGNAARLKGAIGAEVLGANLYLGVGVGRDCQIELLLKRICFPLVAGQTADFRSQASTSEEKLAQQIAKVEVEKNSHFKNDAFPDPTHVEYFEGKIRALKARARPVFLLEDPLPPQLLPALHRSFDAAVLAIFRNDTTFAPLIEIARTRKPALFLDLVKKSWCQENFAGAYLERISDCPLVEPSLSLLCLCSPGSLAEMIASPGSVASGVSERFLVFNSNVKPHALVPSVQRGEVTHQDGWTAHLRLLLELRKNGPQRDYRMAGKTLAAFYSFHDELVSQPASLDWEGRPAIEVIMCQCWKLALIDHVLRAPNCTELKSASALAAVALCRWFLEKRSRLLSEFRVDRHQSREEVACQVMLSKIRAKGKVRKWELFRAYNDQRAARHQPVLDRLLKTGVVLEDSEGFLMLKEQPQPVSREGTHPALGR